MREPRIRISGIMMKGCLVRAISVASLGRKPNSGGRPPSERNSIIRQIFVG